MAELIVVEILVSIGVVSLISYFIIMMLHKNHKFEKANEQKRESIRQEKELDRTDALTRGLRLIITDKKQAVK